MNSLELASLTLQSQCEVSKVGGIYTVASAMLCQTLHHDVIAHNLANASTAGYKAIRVSMRSFGERGLRATPFGGLSASFSLPSGVTIGAQRIDFSPGVLERTGNRLDIAIDGNGFLAVRAPVGVIWTRKGNLRIGADGTLTTIDGFQVLGEDKQPILINGDVSITETGEVMSRGEIVGKLLIVQFDDLGALNPIGSGYYSGGTPRVSKSGFVIRSGYIERSNVNALSELVRMLTALRAYEAAAKALQAFDETARRASQAALA